MSYISRVTSCDTGEQNQTTLQKYKMQKKKKNCMVKYKAQTLKQVIIWKIA